MLQILEIKDKKVWETFLNSEKVQFYPLFQSWNWGEVQKKLHSNVLRLGLFKDKKIVGVCQIVDVRAKRGHYFHLRHGPVLLNSTTYFDTLLDFVKEKARESKADFIRMSPLLDASLFNISFFQKRELKNAPIHNMDAETCWVLDITKPSDVLLSDMRKTHRYLIRKAKTSNIKIIRSEKMSDIDKFTRLYNSFSRRKHFTPHKGIKEEFEIFAKDRQAVLFMAEFENTSIAAAIILFTNKMAIYHHGASHASYRNIPASYLLQWEAILEAKKRNIPLYNFWGIAPEDKPNHPWQGLTLFKTGFGGRRINFIHSQDLPLNLNYWKTFFIETAWRIKRGY